MRALTLLLAALTLCGATTAAAQQPVGPQRGPTAEQVQAVQGLTPSEQARREALYGPDWQYRVAPPDPADRTRDPMPEDLSNIDLRLRTDEITMTRMRDAELARENAVIFAVEPALPYGFERKKVKLAFVRGFHPFRAARRGLMWIPERF